MYGDYADRLVQEARISSNLGRIGIYQSDTLRMLMREVRELDQRLSKLGDEHDVSIASQDRAAASAYFVYQLVMHRNKRCAFAYHHQRASHIQEQVWTETDVVNPANLSQPEQAYLRAYTDLVVDFKGIWSDIDLTGSLDPPKDMYVEIRVLKDSGEIQTEYGVFNLTKDSQFFVRQSDVQRLIQQGLIQLV